MKLRVLIIDDEPVAMNGLAEDVAELDMISIVGLADNAYKAIKILNAEPVDLMFLDIEMPGLNGLELLRSLEVKPMVIITTAYQQYALDGFDHGVIDYLLKPISSARLKVACDKALDWYTHHNQSAAANLVQEYFYVKCNGKMERIRFDEILYVEAADNYVFIHTLHKRFLAYMTLKGIQDVLPEDSFVRVHKSFVIAMDHIQHFAGNEIQISQANIPISRNFKADFQKRLDRSRFARR